MTLLTSSLTSLMAFLVLGSSYSFAATVTRKGKLYEIGKTQEKPLFIQTIKYTDLPTGEQKSESEMFDAEGKLSMTEVAVYKGDKIVSQKVEQLQIGEVYELETADGKVKFKTFKIVDGKPELKEEETEKYVENFITGPTSTPFIRANWDNLLADKVVESSFGVFELAKSVGFSFSKKETKESTVVIRMKPSNFFISVLVTPMDLEFDSKERKLMRYIGRTPVRVKKGKEWKPFDSEIIYE